MSAAVTNRRVLEPVEAHIALIAGALLAALAVLAYVFPRGLAYPFAVLWRLARRRAVVSRIHTAS